MAERPITEIQDLIDRISRISAADHWMGDLNPAQFTALAYLSTANQYSRAPSQVAEYLSAMRGTVSRTLKALARKGLIEEQRSETDRRRTSYTISATGIAALKVDRTIDAALVAMDSNEVTQLAQGLKGFVKNMLQARGGRSFGVCATCQHHRKQVDGSYCALLKVSLTEPEKYQICFDHKLAA